MKSHQLLRCIFPDVLADYFDVVDIQESVTQFDFWLDERNFMEKSDHKLGTVSSYGFTSERVIQDFPLRGKAVYLHVRRRKWRDSSNGDIFSRSLKTIFQHKACTDKLYADSFYKVQKSSHSSFEVICCRS